MSNFMKGDITMSLTMAQMSQAVEHWLNSVVLKEPCKVIALKKSRIGDVTTFSVNMEKDDSIGELNGE